MRPFYYPLYGAGCRPFPQLLLDKLYTLWYNTGVPKQPDRNSWASGNPAKSDRRPEGGTMDSVAQTRPESKPPYARCDLCGRNPRYMNNCPFAGDPDGGRTCTAAFPRPLRPAHDPSGGRDWQNARKAAGLPQNRRGV